MRVDLGLEVSVDAFVDVVTDALVAATSSLPTTDADGLRASVVTEAFNISCAFIDADGLATDDELWGLIRAFGSRLGPEFARAVPDDLRRDGTTAGAQNWALTTSDLFEILVGVDRRDHTDRATIYYTHAMALAHTVASLDTHTGRDELLALDAYRSLLLTAIKAEPGKPPDLGPQGAPERAGAPQVAEQDDPPARDLDELLDELDALVGLDEVKREVRLVANLLRVQHLRQERGLPVVASSRHLVFTGNPGTGKTTVARLLAQIYRTLGVVERGQLVETDRSGLVAGFVGQTATKVTEVFDRADEGVLLIDEAYALVRGSDNDFGREAIDTIVKLVEDRRDRLVVIVAGYPDEMGDFVERQPRPAVAVPTHDRLPRLHRRRAGRHLRLAVQRPAATCCDAEPPTAALRAWLEAQPRGQGLRQRPAGPQPVRARRRPARPARGRRSTEPTDLDLTMLTGADLADRCRDRRRAGRGTVKRPPGALLAAGGDRSPAACLGARPASTATGSGSELGRPAGRLGRGSDRRVRHRARRRRARTWPASTPSSPSGSRTPRSPLDQLSVLRRSTGRGERRSTRWLVPQPWPADGGRAAPAGRARAGRSGRPVRRPRPLAARDRGLERPPRRPGHPLRRRRHLEVHRRPSPAPPGAARRVQATWGTVKPGHPAPGHHRGRAARARRGQRPLLRPHRLRLERLHRSRLPGLVRAASSSRSRRSPCRPAPPSTTCSSSARRRSIWPASTEAAAGPGHRPSRDSGPTDHPLPFPSDDGRRRAGAGRGFSRLEAA